MSSKWAVERRTMIDGWEYDCTDEEGNPELFDTPKEAQDEINDFMAVVEEAVANGNMDSTYSRYDYRVVEVYSHDEEG